ncbi:MAG: DEAD/DEAH box helicase family protein, partial [Opitutae bacterium]|nr:DEAD/DEAH box helicase family protein [Opitutae bacterium]
MEIEEVYEAITAQSYGFFQNKTVTPQRLRDYIARMSRAYPECQLDEAKLFTDLDELHLISVLGDVRVIENNEGHEKWFNPDTNTGLKREIEWHFWKHYKSYLINNKNWPKSVVEKIDEFSSKTLSRMEDPRRAGNWDRRGMIVGNVQSGKTANYTALIAKALDSGYKLVIVLSGAHNDLRAQTQARLNEEILGYDREKIQLATAGDIRIGVRKVFKDHKVVNTLTTSTNDGDFSKGKGKAGMEPSKTGDPIILVLKKHVGILKNVIDWATGLGTLDENDNKVVQNVPLFLIDDECDYASIDTTKQERDATGRIIDDWDPTKTNKRIRKLLNGFSRKIYIGYTATPYANIFIHRDGYQKEFGEDLFPRHFLISLPKPTNYMGPEKLF